MKQAASIERPPAPPSPAAPPAGPKGWARWAPLIITLLFAGWYLGKVRVPKDTDWAIAEFGRLPILVDGRHMPIDTFARSTLLLLRGKQSANYEPWKSNWDKPRVAEATEWALEVMVKPETADLRPVIRIDNPDLRGFFALPGEPDPARLTDGKHFSWAQLMPRWNEFQVESRRVALKEVGKRTPYEDAVSRLAASARAYQKLKLTFGPAVTGDLKKGSEDFLARIKAWREAVNASTTGKSYDLQAYFWGEENRGSAPLIAPRESTGKEEESIWASPLEEMLVIERGGTSPTLENYAAMAAAYRVEDRGGFAKAVQAQFEFIEKKGGFFGDLRKASREQLLSYAAPFYWGMAIAVGASLFAILYWFAPGAMEWSRRTAVYLMLLVSLMETVGLIARYLIEGVPPVTTLYTSAIFIGWAAALFGLLLERIYPFSIGVVVASILSFCSLFIAHNLHVKDSTTFTVLVPVLATNFWLATHVVIITLGYAATFVAGLIGLIYIIRAAMGNLPAKIAQAMARMVYAIVCFATLFSFVGTILGGLWADQSWGRFWGWDVKENGALIIVLWNAILLHARWGGLIRERGLMSMAVFGNVVTAWSWFGVNNLNIGLHSYGFTQGAFVALIGFAASQVAFIIVAYTACRAKVEDRTERPA